MPKEWILNSATNRFQLNFKRNVGATSEAIRKCSPGSLEQWEAYYYANVHPPAHLVELGRKLYTKISEVLVAEIEGITELDCVNYIKHLVIDRTYDGYLREKRTIYGQLQDILNIKISPAPDVWDRLYNVDFFIEVKDKYIGLQIKPVSTSMSIPEIFKEAGIQHETHVRFASKYGGKVFYIYSTGSGYSKGIVNTEVIQEIIREINRLETTQP